MFRLVFVVTLALAAPALAGPKKSSKPKPSPPAVKPCSTFVECMDALNDAFERGDFEVAQRHAARSETFALTPREQAQLFAVKGALDAQSLSLGASVKETVLRSFAQAQRLDASLTFIAIPAFARTDELEKLWLEARPVVEPKVEVRTVEVPVVVAPVLPPPPPPKKFPLITTVLLGGAVAATGVGVGFGVSASGKYQQAKDATDDDVRRFQAEGDAKMQGTVANVSFISAGVLGVAALVVFLAVE